MPGEINDDLENFIVPTVMFGNDKLDREQLGFASEYDPAVMYSFASISMQLDVNTIAFYANRFRKAGRRALIFPRAVFR